MEVVGAACQALWAVSMSLKCKLELHKLDVVKYFAKLLQSRHEEIIIATLGAITQCATQVLVTPPQIFKNLKGLVMIVRMILCIVI